MARYPQDAINTAIGRADPINGSQLDHNRNLPNPVTYYKPNAGKAAFVNPSAGADGFLLFSRDSEGSLGVSFSLSTKYTDITAIDWAYGDSGNAGNTTGGLVSSTRHVYSASGSYTATATIHSVAAGGTKAYTVTVAVDGAAAKPTNTVAPTITGFVAAHGATLTAVAGTWIPTGVITYQWVWGDTGAAIAGATASTYTTVVGDVGHTIKVQVTETNSRGFSTASSVATAAVT
jgi:hypothetical protein